MVLTAEQQQIIDDVKRGQHVSVTALPGSGKSMVAYELIRQCPEDTSVILLVYNRSLCDSTSAHIKNLGLSTTVQPGGEPRKIKAFTFHGLASALSQQVCHNDRDISRVITEMEKAASPLTWALDDFTLLVIDEAQDMRPDFMRLVHYLIRSGCRKRQKLRVVVLGDPKQLLYGFYKHNRADARFLSLSHVLLAATNERTWEKRQLTCSFRSTTQVATVLNALIPGHAMVPGGVTDGPPVSIVLCNYWNMQETAGKMIRLVSEYLPDDVMVLCNSLNSKSPAKHMVKALVRHGIPVHVQRSGNLRDVVPVPTASTTGKICFKTFHASKGLEAKLVIVLHSGSVFRPMSNSVYVAITRSVERLVIFQDIKASSAEEVSELYAKVGTHNLTVSSYENVQPTRIPPPEPDQLDKKTRVVAVEEVFSYLDPELLGQLETQLQCTRLDNGSSIFDDETVYSRLFDVRTSQEGQSINVADLLMSTIFLASQYFRTRKIPVQIQRLATSTDPYVLQLYQQGSQVLQMHIPYIADPWAIEQLDMKLQAFAMFATALDARNTYGEKIMEITRFDFSMANPVVRRVHRVVDQMQKYIPDMGTRFHAQRNKQVTPKLVVTSAPTLRSSACLYNLIHRPSTEPEDFLSMALHLCIQGLDYGYLSNIYTGELVMVHLPKADHAKFVLNALDARESCTEDLDEEMFLLNHCLVNTPRPLTQHEYPLVG
jgi:hypothetical protein